MKLKEMYLEIFFVQLALENGQFFHISVFKFGLKIQKYVEER